MAGLRKVTRPTFKPPSERAKAKAAGYESIWRFRAAKVIAAVLSATKGLPEERIKAALRDAYPFGERKMWPYKMWLKEIRYQRKLRRTDKTPMALFPDPPFIPEDQI